MSRFSCEGCVAKKHLKLLSVEELARSSAKVICEVSTNSVVEKLDLVLNKTKIKSVR